jgi:tRNA(fMet)-specific endonuclease VapC
VNPSAAARLLDTDTLSEIMKRRNAAILKQAQGYLVRHGAFTFSLITRYEILRGLKARQATRQLANFEQRCQQSHILPITDDIVVHAADLYAELRTGGRIISDADLFIAATAMIQGLVLVSNNLDHFERIAGLQLESWAAET